MNTIRLKLYRNNNRELSIRQVEYAEEIIRHPNKLKDPELNRQKVNLWQYL